MINVKINGETKKFDSGMTVCDILEKFDSKYIQSTCSVKINGDVRGMDEKVFDDCEIELMSNDDLQEEKPDDALQNNNSDDPSMYDLVPGAEEIAEYTMMELNRMMDDDSSDGEIISSETVSDYADPFEKLAAIMDELDQMETSEYDDELDDEQENTASSEQELSDDNLQPDDTDNDDQNDVSDEWFDDEETVSDGEFISVLSTDAKRKSAAIFSDDIATEQDEGQSEDNTEENAASVSDTDDMQIHPVASKTDAIVADLFTDAASENEDESSDSSGSDYSVDDGDMDAFLSSQIMTAGNGEDHQDDSESETNELPEVNSKSKDFSYLNFDVDESSIDDFVDYGKNNASDHMERQRASCL